MDVIGTLKSVKECIDATLTQMQSLANLHELTLTKMPVYAQAMAGLEKTVDTLRSVFVSEIPDQHLVRFSQLSLLELELGAFNKTLDKCLNWHKSMIYLGMFSKTGVHADEETEASGVTPLVDVDSCAGFWTRWVHMRRVFRVTPTLLEQEVDRAFEKISPLLQEAVVLQREILGSAVEIAHPVLRRAWMCARGENQLNDSNLTDLALTESLYVLLKKEEGGVIVREAFCKDVIANFVRYLDGLAGTAPDKLISLAEIKQFAVTEENSKNVKGLLGLKQQPSEEERVLKVVMDWSSEVGVRVVNTEKVLIPLCEGYGCNWPSKVAATFVVPFLSADEEEEEQEEKQKGLVGVTVRCFAADQGFGGTGHAQVRFQVNDDMPVPAFSVWRDKVLDGKYSFVIGPDKVHVGDTVKIWACSPPWNAWSLCVSDVAAEAKFA